MPPATQQTIADIRVANQDLLSALIAAYVTANEADRSHIRRLFVEHGSFTWAVSYVMKEPSDEELRNCFVYMSMLDQGFDARDYLLAIRSMVQHAKRANLDYRTIMEEIADMSSPVDRFGFGSTRDILQNES